MNDTISCHCDTCSAGCKSGAPGWFAPGEAEEAGRAGAVGVEISELGEDGYLLVEVEFQVFFSKFLSADYWHEGTDGLRDEQNKLILVLAPVSWDGERGKIAAHVRPPDKCVFYDEQKGCNIHEHKPAECRFWDHRKTPEQLETFCRELLERWKPYQGQIVGLLSGRG